MACSSSSPAPSPCASEAPWTVSRGAAVQQMMEQPHREELGRMEAIAAGDETTMTAGDEARHPR